MSPTTFNKDISEESTRMSSNKKRDMEASDDDDEYDEDYKDEGKWHDALLTKIGMLCQRCAEKRELSKG